jgi:hypothetical protein
VQAVTAAASVNREGLIELLRGYGVTRPSEIPESEWPAVVGRLNAMLREAGKPTVSIVAGAAPVPYAKKLRPAPSWFIAPSDVARHPVHGATAGGYTYGPGLFPDRGLGVLIAPPKHGKTSWLTDRAFTWKSADGEPLRTVWLALESKALMLQTCASFELDRPDSNTVQVVPVGAEFDLLDTDSIDALAAVVCPDDDVPLSPAYERLRDRTESPDILVLDSLARAIGTADENSSGTMSGVVAGLEHLRRAFNAKLVIVIHHVPKGQTTPRGHGALLAGVDGCALLTLKGHGDNATVTVRCEAARAFEGGAVRRYRRRVEVHADLVGDSGDLARLVFDAIADAPAPVPAARAAEPPPRAAEPAPAPKPPAHPAERLKGRAAACWAALGLPPGGAMGLEEAKAFCTQHPAFADVAPGRVANRWGDVVGAWRTAGLVDDTGMVRNPAT